MWCNQQMGDMRHYPKVIVYRCKDASLNLVLIINFFLSFFDFFWDLRDVYIVEGMCACMQGLGEDRSVKYPRTKVTGCWSGCWEWNHGPLLRKRKPPWCCPKGHMNKTNSHLARHFYCSKKSATKAKPGGWAPLGGMASVLSLTEFLTVSFPIDVSWTL